MENSNDISKNSENSMNNKINETEKINKIESFRVNHLVLEPGVYVSRKDKVENEVITTFDIRLTRPNYEPVMNTAEIHTIEHLMATYLRNNNEWKERVIYFGPMGCKNRIFISSLREI